MTGIVGTGAWPTAATLWWEWTNVSTKRKSTTAPTQGEGHVLHSLPKHPNWESLQDLTLCRWDTFQLRFHSLLVQETGPALLWRHNQTFCPCCLLKFYNLTFLRPPKLTFWHRTILLFWQRLFLSYANNSTATVSIHADHLWSDLDLFLLFQVWASFL